MDYAINRIIAMSHFNDLLNLYNTDNMDYTDSDESSEEENVQQVPRTPKRYIRDGQNPFEFYGETEFKRRFRFSKHSIIHGILPRIRNNLLKVNNRGLPISPEFQLLICLRFYATASFQVSLVSANCTSSLVLTKNNS